MEDVAIIGVGIEGFRSAIKELSYKELVYYAAVKAYDDAKIKNPREEIDTFVTCAEDYNEGTSIFDEYTPDQLGGARKPMHTISGDGIQGLIAGYMQIASGLVETAVIEAHSKASDIVNHYEVMRFALDPIYTRPFGGIPHYVAALEMRAFINETGTDEDAIAYVAAKNYRNALKNPHAPYGMNVHVTDVLESEVISSPLKSLEIARPSDGAIVIVLANKKIAEKESRNPIWIKGLGWASDSPNFDVRSWSHANYAKLCAKKAYKQAKIKNPMKDVDIFEVDDAYAYKELQHLEGLDIYQPGCAGRAALEGDLDEDGYTPVNLSGGVLGVGNGHEANGLMRIAELVYQLRGIAGQRQLNDIETGLAFSWRGIPTATGALAILNVAR